MPRLRSCLLTLLLACAFWSYPLVVRAWNPTGHMIVASFAYDQLSPETRSKWATVLRSHPAFATWEQAAPKDHPGFDFNRYLFLRASTWPDDIRRSGSPYEHSVWHYIDYPLVMPACPMEPAPANTEDILFGLDTSEKTLLNPASAPVDGAASLSWIIHLVGDIQQPLHCVTLINDTYPRPAGDRGGNLFFVSVAGNSLNLHAVWDGLPGTLLDTQDLTARARELTAHFPRTALPELTVARDPHAWSLEGRYLAVDAVYRRGALPGGHDQNAVLPPLPANYLPVARALAERRLALGGYRLADTLQQLAAAPQR